MNLYIRLLLFFLRLRFRPKLKITDISALRFRVLPNDLDLNMHMNNGRYLTIMDIGRLDIMVRAGVLKKAMKHKFIPVLGGIQMRYRIPLMPFQSYTLESRIISWDAEQAYMLQQFIINTGKKAGAVAAIGIVKGRFFDTRNNKSVPIDTILDFAGETGLSAPPMPEYFTKWIEAETALKAATTDLQK